MSDLTHLDEHGAARMVDVSDKETTAREAVAEAVIVLSAEAFAAVMDGTASKGDVLATARIAGIMAAKKTSELIPLCHPLPLAKVGIEFQAEPEKNAIRIAATVKTIAQTGVEMEALTAAGIAALTIYDMVKALDKGAVIETIRLLTKSGGKSGAYFAPQRPKVEPPVERIGERPAERARARARPATLGHETAPPPPKGDPNAEREAFRNFMVSRQLRATEWAKQAGVPASQIYSYLTGRSRGLSPDAAEKLALAARARVEDMFRR
jgi:cyclic pyranopterin phosphate synthase